MAVNTYDNLVKGIEKEFPAIDSDIMVNFRKQDKDYEELCKMLGKMEQESPFIMQILEDERAISLTAEEHEILREYFRQAIKKGGYGAETVIFPGTYGRICLSETDRSNLICR